MKFAARSARIPDALPEWDPRWSRLLTVDTLDGARTFHVLDTLPALREEGFEPTGTIVALHGNPTWSYLWRHVAAKSLHIARAGGKVWRVVAPDQIDMGYSERLEHDALPTTHGPGYRRIPERVLDFDAVVSNALAEAETEHVVSLGHDWGGVLSLTWAARHLDRVSAVMSLNTAVHQPENEPIPAALRAALAGPMLPTSTVLTDWFLRTTLALGQGPLSRELKKAFSSPYHKPADRAGIGSFVADIPVDERHPSYAELQQLGEDIAGIDVPALLVWGPKDPVFQERYLRDLRHRLPQADVHRFEKASHLVSEDFDVAGVIFAWLATHFGTSAPAEAGAAVPEPALSDTSGQDGRDASDAGTGAGPMIFDELAARAGDTAVASVDMTREPAASVSWRTLAGRVDAIAAGLQNLGLERGDRVSLLVQPGNDLTTVAYGVLKAGGVAVVADAGLGPAGMTRAIRSADPQWIIGETAGLALARGARWPGRRISMERYGATRAAALGVETSIADLMEPSPRASTAIAEPGPADLAAILFTSGSTGPAKGVQYTHAQLGALSRVLRSRFGVEPGTGLVAGFAPFALLGPGIGATSVTPDMSVTKPRTLTATALADAISTGDCTMVFASPAAYTNVCATAGDLSLAQRQACAKIELVLSAGAPVPLSLMDRLAELFPHAEIHSPYGMTEALLLTDIDRTGVTEAAESDNHGTCVGSPIPGVRFMLAPIDATGIASETLVDPADAVGVLGEFVVSAGHMKDGYDRLWKTDADSKRDSSAAQRWHRTNDIGHVDAEGRVWLEGRLQHVVTTPAGPVGPGGLEAAVDTLPGVLRSAVVGVGPLGTQAVVVVVEADAHPALGEGERPHAVSEGEVAKPGIAPLWMSDAVRDLASATFGIDVAAVLVSPTFPTDIRHNSKIDRSRLARWADEVLRGGKVGKP